MARRPMLQADDERYSAAIEELSRALGPGRAFQAARLWGLDQCRKAQQLSWPTSSVEKKATCKDLEQCLGRCTQTGGPFGD